MLKNSTNRTDILLLIFPISTCKSSYHLYTCRGTSGYLQQLYMDYFQYDEQIHQKFGQPSVDFPCFLIHFIMSQLQWWFVITCTFHISTWIFFYVLKNSTRNIEILLQIFHVSTSNVSCWTYNHSCNHLYITHFHMEFFLWVKKFHQKGRHPSMDFPLLNIKFIMSPLY